ncbi:SAM-dependent methyltransferase [Halarcobacter bivalviorum]|uniref:Tellurite resistance protein TehB n=1 Tax=Halarcobacter bivalviorum TaxID=663364 RepID=A0AAX2A9V0_9BACT|nr:methyltransferase domain-containing protein [Halarcobacter bivalviorum]AXH11204.1 putative tellurite resistance protein TehB [Halarcobacter bivalviorum]RXK09476.1 tellurium resistance protein [Halarcobacter bivalviorum]
MSQQEFWNQKFSRDGFLYGLKPNSFISSKIKSFPANSKVLCLGEGEGRNAIFLAQRGFEVSAIDASDIGLSKLQQRAKEEGLNIKTICIDLNEWEVEEKYDVIVASYLHMYEKDRDRLFDNIDESLKENGIFVGEFFSQNQLKYDSGGPKDKELLYKVEDFKTHYTFSEAQVKEQITILDEGKGHQGEASVIRVVLQKS